ncbi:universal stress protein [Demetria terragena]|uniref:universal stress protein n=1 Tax=Demetria terragena TaxID=63959 RepID=UPI00036DA329|nr:universal stress protein [Demetria terragena]
MSVVLGYDESEGSQVALRTALEVARRFGEELVLVYGAAPPGGVGEEWNAHRAALREMGRTALDHAMATAAEAGITARVEIVDAKPAEALIAVGDAENATCIVVGISGESPLRGAMMGSTPHKLLQLSTRPVLCVPIQ